MLLIASGSRVYRYDPVNQVSLGSFATVGLAGSVAVDQSTGELYSLSAGTVGQFLARYNIWTGEFLGSVSVPTSYGNASAISKGANGELLLSTWRDVVRINPLTGAQIGVPLFYTDRKFTYASRHGVFGDGSYLLAGESDGTLWANDYAMMFTPGNTWFGSYMMPGGYTSTTYRDVVVRGDTALVAYNGPGGLAISRLRKSGTSLPGLNLISGYTLPLDFVEFGHFSNAYAIGQSSSTAYVRGFDSEFGAFGLSSQFTLTTTITGTAIFLAPEPGSLAVMGLGLAAFGRLRRSARGK